MHQSEKTLYFDLLPPSPFLREINKVFSIFWAFVLIGFALWAFNFPGQNPQKGYATDTLIVGSALALLWYSSVFVTSAYRLNRYIASGRDVPPVIYQLLLPWIVMVGINATMIMAAVLDYGASEPAGGRKIVRWVLGVIPLLLAFEIPGVKSLAPKLDPRRFYRFFRRSLPVLLGRQYHETVEEHAKHVVNFEREVTKYVASVRLEEEPDPVPRGPLYYDPVQLETFQNTLGCLYTTSRALGEDLKPLLTNRQWSMLDVGCGEGRFTSNMLSTLKVLPNLVTALDPAEENTVSYRRELRAIHTGIPRVETILGTIENKINDLPAANVVLVSHSLYAVLDHDRQRAAEIVNGLISKSNNGACIFVMASQDSYLYTIKRAVLGELRLPDRSSYAEDLAGLLRHVEYQSKEFDSFVDVSALLKDRDKLLSWMAYFCRLKVEELEAYFELCQSLVANAAIEVRSLPLSDKKKYHDYPHLVDVQADERSRQVIYHKELVISVLS